MNIIYNKISRKSKGTRKNTSGSTNFKEQIVKIFLQFLITIKLYHWNTLSYSTHKATDELYSKLNEGIDTFVEANCMFNIVFFYGFF